MLLGIFDYCLVYVMFKLGSKRLLLKIICIRNFKNFNVVNFKVDIEKIFFYILEIFYYKDDVFWGWE